MRNAPLIPIILLALLFSTSECPAPFVYTPREGWIYETPAQAGKWQRDTAKEQLKVAQEAYDQKDYRIAVRAAGRVIRQWPFSDYAPEAQYLTGLAHEGNRRDEKAFKAYQEIITKYPKYDKYDEVLQRQFEIANKFLSGQRFRLWGLFPLFRSMDKTTEMYRDLIKHGPYSEVAPKAQLNIGAASEKKKDFAEAVVAYETAADKYSDIDEIAAEALYRAGNSLLKEAKEAEYDQSVATRAIEVFNDFIALYPDDERISEAEQNIRDLRVEQARGSLQIARYYDKKNLSKGALTYYNNVVDIFSRLLNDTQHKYAVEARERIAQLKAEVAEQPETNE
ncbi:MAG: Outer membrane protein assembly factor BamD [Verrucomicrobia subdivision 3 bacterium]|nr:Outer membrane protein assembly factor BamD [Limisphaerales bacterium]MCS1412443.1 Outer membrane protein assembly factor BamD [Limisphaerales bacterium]